jgi:predicted metal-dependent hydrolase
MTTAIQPMVPPNEPPRRLLPDRAYPAYAHIPGTTPHPIRDPRGHSYGRHDPACDPPDLGNWQDCERFQWGIDLFNAGYYWESHEAWEAVWIAAGRKGPTADFLKALIKLAAAGVKLREQNDSGARRHLRRAVELFETAGDSGAGVSHMFGLSINQLRLACERLQAAELASDLPPDGCPTPVLGMSLWPE